MDTTLVRKTRLVERNDYLVECCRGRSILHLGCTDAPFHEQRLAAGRMLQPLLVKAGTSVVGVDIDAEALAWMDARWPGEYRLGDVEDATFMSGFQGRGFEVVLLPDVLEHLNNPFLALKNIRAITTDDTDFVVTVPNAYAVKCFLRAVVGRESVHPDHVSFHSFATLSGLLRRAGFEVTEVFSFVGGGTGVAATITNAVLRLIPQLAEGIGVRCRVSTKG